MPSVPNTFYIAEIYHHHSCQQDLRLFVGDDNGPAKLRVKQNKFSRDALDMVAALEGTEGKQFKKAAVFDGAGERVAEFSSFPRKKRFFMLGVWPWQEEFLLLSKDIKMVEPFYDEATDRILCVAAGPATAFQKEWKSLLYFLSVFLF